MKKKSETNAQHYLDAAKAWETDEISKVKKSERRAWIVAGVAGVLSVLSIVAVVLLTPLKTVEPFVVRVDKIGAADVVTLLNTRTISGSEALDKYWLSQYVNYREEYSKPISYGNFKATELMSTQAVRDNYFELVRPDRPTSPTAIYGSKGIVEVEVTNVSFLGNGHAQVRFTRKEKRDPGLQATVTRWIATVAYDYINPPMDEKARLINPVGFQVGDYRLDPETVAGG